MSPRKRWTWSELIFVSSTGEKSAVETCFDKSKAESPVANAWAVRPRSSAINRMMEGKGRSIVHEEIKEMCDKNGQPHFLTSHLTGVLRLLNG